MPTAAYNFLSGKNDGLALSPSQLISRYFFGIPLVTPTGEPMSEEDLLFHIKFAMEEYEGYLNLKLTKQVIVENLHYTLNDYYAWGYVPTTYPVLCVESLVGYLGQQQQIEWPREWISIKRDNNNSMAHRNVYLVPSQGTVNTNNAVYNGTLSSLGLMSYSSIPNFWQIKYVTSFDTIPEDILMAVGKLATMNIFNELGDITLGAGVQSQSIGIDGLSQSIATTNSSTNAGYGARIIQYAKELKEQLPLLKAKYDGMTLTSL